MKKIVLSVLAALTLGSVAAEASSVTLYSDASGQVFTQAGEGRTAIKSTPVQAKASKLKFSGNAFLGFTHTDYKDGSTEHDKNEFEVRRAYFQVKGYLLDDPKSYFRLTLDVKQKDDGDLNIRAKYAYLYLNNILPATSLELGLVHRPWHSYETGNAWYFRNISKGFIENKNSSALSSSADFGFNFKTKTQYFDSEVGIFNGEGYHSDFNDDENSAASQGLSAEWRATAHILGVNGKGKQTKKTYFDASFFGQYNVKHDAAASHIVGEYNDLVFMGVHTVYNQPALLVSAQYINSLDTTDNTNEISKHAGSGYSANGEYRFGEKYQFSALARFDTWTLEELNSADETKNNTYIVGVSWKQNKNIQWVANATVTDNEDDSSREKYNGTAYMITTQVKF